MVDDVLDKDGVLNIIEHPGYGMTSMSRTVSMPCVMIHLFFDRLLFRTAVYSALYGQAITRL
jgi:hypothetical protein